ncbi:hypothetical protein [Actinoplanes sp. G11-F43]|uniref:hypothetical protein n=1 Tax=Actinoplanes sp. G11-F43 TaxID=3424130 RepID=UPI003D3450B4
MAVRTHLLLAVAVIAPLVVAAAVLAGWLAGPDRALAVILWVAVVGGVVSGSLVVVGLRRRSGQAFRAASRG